MKSELSRDLALRIALAGRALPGVGLGRLVGALSAQLGWPLTEARLARLTVAQLKQALAGEGLGEDEIDERFGLPRLKEAVEILWGRDARQEDLPAVVPYSAGELPGSIRVAVASDSGEDLNAHFGSCRRFLVYQVDPEEVRLVALRCTAGAEEAEDGSAFRAELIRDCHVLFVQSIGGPAAAKVINTGIYPLKFNEGGPARVRLDELRRKMASSPPPWLAKAMNIPVEDRIRFHQEAPA